MAERNLTIFGLGVDFIPDQINTDANNNISGDWIALRNYERAYLLLTKPAGTAGDDLKVTINQATNNSGGSSKVAAVMQRIWYKVGTMTSQNTWTAVDLGASPVSALDFVSVNGTDIVSDTNPAVVLIEVMADALDTNNGFCFVQAAWDGTEIGNALLINSHWILTGNAYPRSIPLTALS